DILTPQEEVTLIRYGNVVLRNECALPHQEGSVKSTKKKLNWVDQSSCIPGILVTFPSQDAKTWFEDSIKRTKIWGESNMHNIVKGQVIQLIRHGLFRCEASCSKDQILVLFQIPNGKPST